MMRASLLLNLDLEGVHCEWFQAVHRELCARAAIHTSYQGSQGQSIKKMKVARSEFEILPVGEEGHHGRLPEVHRVVVLHRLLAHCDQVTQDVPGGKIFDQVIKYFYSEKFHSFFAIKFQA